MPFDKVRAQRADPAGGALVFTGAFDLGLVGKDQLMYQLTTSGGRIEKAHGNLHLKKFGKAGLLHLL